MLASQQMHDTLHHIKMSKGILPKMPPININLTQLAQKASNQAIFNLDRNTQHLPSETIKGNTRNPSLPSSLLKTDQKPKKTNSIFRSNYQEDIHDEPAKMMESKPKEEDKEEEPNFIRAPRHQVVSNSTQVPSDRKIIKYLNNLKGAALSNLIESTNLNDQSKAIRPKIEVRDNEKVNSSAFYSIYSSNLVEEYSYKEDQNILFKEAMEDKGKSVEAFNFNRNNLLFCLFDGHGGDAVSIFLQKNFPLFFKKSLENHKGNIEEALRQAFITIDNELRTLELVRVGSTGCVVYITKEKDATVVYCANIGDTRASLIKPSTYEYRRLSYDHRADDPQEKKRIINQGGMVLNGRVMGQLMLSRAFGDFQLKSFGVKSEPYITKTIINEAEQNQFIFIASDGIWDVMDEKEINKILMYTFDTETLVEKILARCMAEKAWDNLSVFAIKLC